MGYRKQSIKYAHDMIDKAGFKLENLRMCELGNQLIFDKEGYEGFFVAKEYFESLGVHHVSIDWNGKHGSLPLDLNKPISIGEFDVVTNLGTTEHVKNNKQCFENIHNLCKVGGIMIHLVPHKGRGKGHGLRQYTLKWFEDLIKEYNYEVLHFERNGKYEWKETENRIYAVLRKIE